MKWSDRLPNSVNAPSNRAPPLEEAMREKRRPGAACIDPSLFDESIITACGKMSRGGVFLRIARTGDNR